MKEVRIILVVELSLPRLKRWQKISLTHHILAVVIFKAFFKFVPLKIGLPLVAFVILIVQARAKLIASKFKPLLNGL